MLPVFKIGACYSLATAAWAGWGRRSDNGLSVRPHGYSSRPCGESCQSEHSR